MSCQNLSSHIRVGQFDHPFQLPSPNQISDECHRQRDRGQSFRFVHGMLFHRDYGHIDVFGWMPRPESHIDHTYIVLLVDAYRSKVTVSLLLTIDEAMHKHLAYEKEKCERILTVFSAAGYDAEPRL